MRHTLLGAAIALTLLVVGCAGNKDDSGTSSPAESASPATSAPPEPDIEAQIDALAKDALALDGRSKILRPRLRGTEDLENALYDEETRIAGIGTLYMPSALTIRFPGPIQAAQARKFLRLFEEHGFGTGLTYDVSDFLHGQVQRGDGLRCKLELEPGSTWLRCIPMAFFDLVEWDVANAITTLYSEETDSMSLPRWEVLYPHPHDSEPPVGAVLRTDTDEPHDQFRVYLYRDGGWELVARARSYADAGHELAAFMCLPDTRSAFPIICPDKPV